MYKQVFGNCPWPFIVMIDAPQYRVARSTKTKKQQEPKTFKSTAKVSLNFIAIRSETIGRGVGFLNHLHVLYELLYLSTVFSNSLLATPALLIKVLSFTAVGCPNW